MKKVKDHYYNQAKQEGFSARSAFKLKEIDEKYRLIKKGMTVLDLGASPGSWTEYTFSKIGETGRIVAVDLKPLKQSFPQSVTVLQEDVFKLSPTLFPDHDMKFDLILSDMASNTTGNKGLNHQQSIDLCSKVIMLCDELLKPKGDLVCKIFQGEDLHDFLMGEVKPGFQKYKLFKPKSSRKESVEMFILGFGFKKPFAKL